MTAAPPTLLETRTLLLDKLGPYGLKPLSVGIVGDADHRGGYHCGSDRVLKNDYSVVESSRDRNGLTRDAAALDVGEFSYRDAGGKVHNLRTFSVWCVEQCKAGAPDTADIREIIYSPDGKKVVRWDRLGRRSTGDKSHLTHTHFSFFRDSTGRDLSKLFRRYLAMIGLLGEELMFVREGESGQGVKFLQYRLLRLGYSVGDAGADGVYGKGVKAAVKAAELAFNPNYKGDGSTALSETWTRLDEMYIRMEAQKMIAAALKGLPIPAPALDYKQLEKTLDYRTLGGAVLQAVQAK